jgi:AhpD family alkylhydroperoxidase
MNMRFNVAKDTPQLYDALMSLNGAVAEAKIESRLIHLIKIRVSQINGCAFCVGMHVKEAIDDGVTEKELHLLSVWRESSAFTARDKSALAWAETLTLLAGSGVPNADFDAARTEFSEAELAALTVAVGTMNLWNRIGVGAQMPE